MKPFKLSKATIETFERAGREKAKELAIDAREKLTREYISVVSRFYNDYSPTYYHRVWGLYDSFTKHYKNPHNSIYRGGIALTQDGIRVNSSSGIEKETKSQYAFDAFLKGYHGAPSLDIKMSFSPYEYMIGYRDNLIQEYRSKYGRK